MSPHSPPLRYALAALLIASPLSAEPLRLPDGALQIGARAEAPARHALPIGAFDGQTVPSQIVSGTLDQRAYRIDGLRGNTLALLQPLITQLTASGYQVLFTCDTTACGGFDFRFAIDVLPEPQMHVDLGDFRFLAARNSAGDALSLLVSRSADQGFVQVTSVAATGAAATVTTPEPSATAPEAEPPLAQTVAPQPDAPSDPTPPPPPGDFAARLMTTGSIALDDLIFASGKATLADQDYASLAALTDWLIRNPAMTVTLVGHTDATGSLAGNVALSKQRAAAVKARLVQRHNAPAAQIDAQGAGYLSPRATNQTPEGRTKNRRVEVMLTSTPAKSP